ncbi:MAG TPA: LysR family transcriptional regulator [Myxococcota bacterium]|nr:LysR family transcriptional regulator [Myxococcota bacterium]
MAKRSIDVRLRIDLAPSGSVGPGKIALLEAIDATGSLSQAARDLGMSYRRAWGLLDDLNHSLREPVAAASAGGAGGGGAALTEFGRELVATYRAVERIAVKAAKRRFSASAKREKPVTRALRRPLSRRNAKGRSAKRATRQR